MIKKNLELWPDGATYKICPTPVSEEKQTAFYYPTLATHNYHASVKQKEEEEAQLKNRSGHLNMLGK